MPDNSERRQEGTDDNASDSGGLQLGHAIYARHAHFPGVSSVGSHIVRRIAQFNAGSSSLGQRLYRRWAGGSGSGFSWPDMEWLHAYRGGQATATNSSPQRMPFSGKTTSFPNLGTATTPILRSTEAAPAPIDPAASSKSAPLAGVSDGGLTPQAQDPIVAARVDPQNPPPVYEAESTPVLRGERKIDTHSSIERQQGKQPSKADANAALTSHSKGPAYLGRAILQRSTERGRSDTKPNVSGPPTASGALPASAFLNRQNRQLSSGVEPTKAVYPAHTIEHGKSVETQHGDQRLRAPADQSARVQQRSNDTNPDAGIAPIAAGPLDPAGTHVAPLIAHTAKMPVPVLRSTAPTSTVQGETAIHRRQPAEGPHSAESLTEHVVRPESGKSSQEPSLDTSRVDGNTQAIEAAAQPRIEEPQSPEKQASQSPSSARFSNHVLPAAELPRKEGILQAPRVETVHLAQARTVNRSESGPDGGNISMEPASMPIDPIISSTTQSPGEVNASDAKRQGVTSPATSAELHPAPKGLPATRDLNLAQNSPAPVFRSLALPGSGTPFTPAPQNFGAHVLQQHRKSLITRLVDVGVGHNPDKTVVQPASANLSENRVDLATSRAEQIEQERRLPAQVSNLTHVAPSALALTASQPPMSSDSVGDIPLHSGLEAASPAPEIVAQPVIQRESDSAIPVVEGGAPVVPAKSGIFDGAPTRTHRIPEVSDSHTATSYTLAAFPRGLSSNELDKKSNQTGQVLVAPDAHGRPQAALQRLERSAIRGPSTLERAPRVHVVNDRQMNMPSVTVSRSREEARAVSPSSTTHVGPSSILPAVQTTSQEHDSPHTGGHAGSSFFPSVHGASLLHNMVHRSSLNTVQDRAIQLRQPSLSPFRSVSLTHRAAPIMDGLQPSPASAASGSHFLARQGDGSPAPSTVPAAVPLPSASSSTYQAGKASQSFKNVDVGQLANRVYDLLVRRLASERQRRGL